MALNEPEGGEGKKAGFVNALQYLAIGSEVVATVVGPIGLGYWFDLQFETSPKGLLAGFVLMIILVVQFLRQLIQKFNK
jgi:F0F1-type ATP synthase assembly protein I